MYNIVMKCPPPPRSGKSGLIEISRTVMYLGTVRAARECGTTDEKKTHICG